MSVKDDSPDRPEYGTLAALVRVSKPAPLIPRRWLALCAVIWAAAQALFLIHVEYPASVNFDEFHYVPSAKQFLDLKENQNYEHPPLGKELMAVGIGVFGDNPFGWRVMSTFFGALTLVGMFLWAMALFRDERSALWVVGITLANQLLYVQARIGMLDTFMFAFLAFAMAFFTEAWSERADPRRLRRLMRATGLMLGLATACKWFGLIPWAMVIGLIVLMKGLQLAPVTWRARADDWYSPKLFAGLRVRDVVLELGLYPLVAYFVTFLPFFFLTTGGARTPLDLLQMQWRMWDGQSRVVNAHPYMSTWLDWPLLKRPIWYAFETEAPEKKFVRGVFLLGNPLVMWTGLLAIAACIWSAIYERRREAFLIAATWIAFYLSWAVIPRKVAFYYYYYPAGMVLGLALAYVLNRVEELVGTPERRRQAAAFRWGFLTAAIALFLWFFPILAALRIPTERFRQWMWLKSWI